LADIVLAVHLYVYNNIIMVICFFSYIIRVELHVESHAVVVVCERVKKSARNLTETPFAASVAGMAGVKGEISGDVGDEGRGRP